MKRILASILDLAMLSTLTPGYAPIGESGGGQSSPVVNTGSNTSHTIATNNFDASVYSLDTNAAYGQNAANTLGTALNVTNNEFIADRSITQLQNQLISAPDGITFLGISETLFPAAAQYYKDTEAPHVFFICASRDEDVVAFEQGKYYVGTMIYSPRGERVSITELVLVDGCKATVIPAGVLGDYTHDRRITDFTEAFETDGGGVLFAPHSTDPSGGVQRINDLSAAYSDADCIYTYGSGYVAPAVGVVKSRDLEECGTYGADINPNVCQSIMDGEIEACNGGAFTSCGVVITLLINHLDGDVIGDSEGKTPYFDSLELSVVASDNAEDFYKFLSDEALSIHTISDEKYQDLLVRNNTEVNYDYYMGFMTNYAKDVYAKVGASTNRA